MICFPTTRENRILPFEIGRALTGKASGLDRMVSLKVATSTVEVLARQDKVGKRSVQHQSFRQLIL